jgi:hypothetical protein
LDGGGFATTPGVLVGGGVVTGVGGDASLLNCAIAPVLAVASNGAELRSLADAVSIPTIV